MSVRDDKLVTAKELEDRVERILNIVRDKYLDAIAAAESNVWTTALRWACRVFVFALAIMLIFWLGRLTK